MAWIKAKEGTFLCLPRLEYGLRRRDKSLSQNR